MLTDRRPRKQQLNTRLSPEGRALLLALAAHHGVSQADVVEMALRHLARRDMPVLVKLRPTSSPERR